MVIQTGQRHIGLICVIDMRMRVWLRKNSFFCQFHVQGNILVTFGSIVKARGNSTFSISCLSWLHIVWAGVLWVSPAQLRLTLTAGKKHCITMCHQSKELEIVAYCSSANYPVHAQDMSHKMSCRQLCFRNVSLSEFIFTILDGIFYTNTQWTTQNVGKASTGQPVIVDSLAQKTKHFQVDNTA